MTSIATLPEEIVAPRQDAEDDISAVFIGKAFAQVLETKPIVIQYRGNVSRSPGAMADVKCFSQAVLRASFVLVLLLAARAAHADAPSRRPAAVVVPLWALAVRCADPLVAKNRVEKE